MSASKPSNPFLKKASGPKPPNRKEIKRGLGRGLSALSGAPIPAAATAPAHDDLSRAPVVAPPPVTPFAVPAAAAPAAGSVVQVPPLDIERSPWQPRTDFNEEALKELAASIRANGVIQPLVCRRRADGRLELIAGERRLRASVMAGLKKVPVVLADASDRKAAEMAVIENIQRKDLNVIEEAEGYRLLKETFEITQEDLGERVGKSRSAVANALRLLELPDEVKQLLSQNLLSTGHAKVLLSLDDEKDRVLLARECVTDGLTVRALERKVAKRKEPVPERQSGTPDMPPSHVNQIVDELHKLLGCAVRLTSGVSYANGRHSKGVLQIDFADNDDLDRILSAMGVQLD